MNKLIKISLNSLSAILFLTIFASVTAAQLVIDFDAPFRLKDLQVFETADGSGEIWSVGGNGNLVINTRDNRLDKTISKVDLNSLFFVDRQTAFVAGDSGELLVTENRGESWKKIELKTEVDLKSVFCLNKNKCWIVGHKDGTLISGGIGGNWKIESIVSDGEFEDVYFINEKVGFAVGDDNLLLKTDDGGESWWRINLNYKTKVWQFVDGTFRFEAVSFLNDKIGCVTGWDVGTGIVACTKDQGENWKVNLIGSSFVGIVWKSANEAYLIDSYGKNYVSKDAGQTWKLADKK